jgi:hypothetical protein
MLVGHVDRIGPDLVSGWAAETENPDSVEEVIIYVDGKRAARIPCDRLREDLRDLRSYGDGRHGFRWEPSPPLTELLGGITVRFARTAGIVPHGERTFGGNTDLTPILVTAPGRSGTTLLMQRLSQAPQVCAAEIHPFEVRLISYWATAVQTLTAPADHEHSMHPDRLEGDGTKVGSNPFSDPEYAQVFRERARATDYFEAYMPRQLQDTARTAIREYYQRIGDDRQKTGASFFAEKSNNLLRSTREFARGLFPDLKEIVLIRDPRDLLCSQLAYFRRELDDILREITQSSRELLRIKEQEADALLLLKYEELVLDPQAALSRIAAYLGIKEMSECTDPQEHLAFKAHGTSRSPEASVGRWKRELSPEQSSSCNNVWRTFLSDFGYEI